MRLTEISLRNLPIPQRGQKSYGDETLPGFSCRVSQGGTRTFVLMHGRDRQLTTIGRYPVISLAEARAEAKRLLAEQTLGKRRPVRVAASEALTRFLGEQTQKNSAGTVKQTEALLRNHFPKLLLKSLEDVTTDDVTRVTDKLLEKEQPGAANHAFTAARTFLRWCVRRRYLQHSPIEGIELPAKAASRERVLTDDELKAVWSGARHIGYPFGTIVQLLILTGQRRTEIGSLQAGYLVDDTISLPHGTTKNKKGHSFPIGSLVKAALNTVPDLASLTSDAFLFPAQGHREAPFRGWSKSKVRLDTKAKIQPWTLHDLRRTFATNLQKLGVRLEVIEGLLNHVSGTRAGIVGIYQRHNFLPEMRVAIELWEKHLQTLIATA